MLLLYYFYFCCSSPTASHLFSSSLTPPSCTSTGTCSPISTWPASFLWMFLLVFKSVGLIFSLLLSYLFQIIGRLLPVILSQLPMHVAIFIRVVFISSVFIFLTIYWAIMVFRLILVFAVILIFKMNLDFSNDFFLSQMYLSTWHTKRLPRGSCW